MRRTWAIACVLALAIGQLAFDGSPTSEVAGSLTFFLVVVCLPSSLIAYPSMFGVLDLFSNAGAHPFDNQVALSAVWDDMTPTTGRT